VAVGIETNGVGVSTIRSAVGGGGSCVFGGGVQLTIRKQIKNRY